MKKTYIEVRFDIEGLHNWDSEHVGIPAPKGVEYLEYPHRHRFFWHVVVEVSAARQIEFILFRQAAIAVAQRITPVGKCVPISCEEMAEQFHVIIGDDFPELDRADIRKIAVSEDGENGAIVCWS